jgi:hypothetical protein
LVIKYAEAAGDPEIIVEDFDNIVLYWQRLSGERVAACSKCLKLFVQRTNMQQMCRKCWKDESKRKMRELQTKNYQKKKEFS